MQFNYSVVSSSFSFNNLISSGLYAITITTGTNAPAAASGFLLVVSNGTNGVLQLFYPNSGSTTYSRVSWFGAGWGTWVSK